MESLAPGAMMRRRVVKESLVADIVDDQDQSVTFFDW